VCSFFFAQCAPEAGVAGPERIQGSQEESPPMTASPAAFALASYGFGAAAYAVLAIQVGTRRGWSGRAGLLLFAALSSFLWQVTGLAVALAPTNAIWTLHLLADGLRLGAWSGFVLALLTSLQVPGFALRLSARIRVSFAAGLTAVHWAATLAGATGMLTLVSEDMRPLVPSYGVAAVAAVVGLSLCEQLFRGTAEAARWGIKPLVLGLGAMFAYDLFMFSDALLLRDIDQQVWTVRGVVHALAIPLILLATARNRNWTIDVAVSRNIIFGSTALLLSGLYMLAVAGAGYYVRFFGGDWGRAIQAVFLFIALLVLALLLFSGSVRSRLRVFINKNFFSYRYDYREEWLGFTKTLASAANATSIVERSIQALADLVESPAGLQWWRDGDGVYRPAGRWNAPAISGAVSSDDSLVRFLATTWWVVNLDEFRANPKQYPDLELPQWLCERTDAWLIIPMPEGSDLGGFVVLQKPRTRVEIDWEVLDLLKTAARQAATVIGQVRATEALVEAQQFSAFNRMSAFVVHDLKNLVAQLSLMLKNAERHSANPEFQKDMRSTIEHVVDRMNRLLLQLRSGATPIGSPAPVDLGTVAARIQTSFARQGRDVVLESSSGIWAMAHEERIERVLGHLVQNAFDAMDGRGTVTVRVMADGAQVMAEVEDKGKGMSGEFIREQLFKPFRSTKVTGMGIGAYESQQYVSELGGRITVESTVGAGTRMRVILPARSRDIASDESRAEAA